MLGKLQKVSKTLTLLIDCDSDMWKQEGVKSFYKGITPRVMRVAPGQAVTFTVYEFLKEKLEHTVQPCPISTKVDLG